MCVCVAGPLLACFDTWHLSHTFVTLVCHTTGTPDYMSPELLGAKASRKEQVRVGEMR